MATSYNEQQNAHFTATPAGEENRDQVAELMLMIAGYLPVTVAQYPSLAFRDHEPVASFCVQHSALHFSKTAGQLAAIAEAIDHGHAMEVTSIRKIAINSIINSFKLANEIGLTSDELIKGIHDKFNQ